MFLHLSGTLMKIVVCYSDHLDFVGFPVIKKIQDISDISDVRFVFDHSCL